MTIPAPAFQLPSAMPAAPAAAIPPPAPQPAPTPSQNLETLVDKYRQLRDRKKLKADTYKAQVEPYTEAMDQLGAAILDALNRAGVESIRTKSGTAFKTTRSSYTVKDPALFREWIEANQRFDLLETRVSKEAVEAMVQAGQSLPEGIGISSEVLVNIRK
jgi:hypothetical protein